MIVFCASGSLACGGFVLLTIYTNPKTEMISNSIMQSYKQISILVIVLSCGVNDYKNVTLSGKIDKDIALFKNIFSRDAVLRTREILIGEVCAVI